MNAPHFEPGPLAPVEDGVYHFVSYVAQAYQGSAARRPERWQGVRMAYYLSVGDVPRSGTPSTATPTATSTARS